MSPEALQQRMSALDRANEKRVARARVKKAIKAREVCARGFLIDPPEWADTMRVDDLLRSVPKMGRVKTERLLRKAGLSPSKHLGRMTDRQRSELARVLP